MARRQAGGARHREKELEQARELADKRARLREGRAERRDAKIAQGTDGQQGSAPERR